MSSTYSSTLRIQLIDTNTEFEAWGQPTDNNLGTIIEQAIVGANTISLTNLTTYTLSTANAAPDQARNAVLVFNGALNANCNVIAPSVQKVYIVSNQTTNNKSITIKTSGGNGVQLANGTNQLVYCDGTNFQSAVNVNNIVGDLSVSGNSTVGGNVSVGTTVTLGSAITGTSGNLALKSQSNVVNFQPNSGALIPPRGTTSQRPSSPVLGMSRWNTSVSTYEIWNGVIWEPIPSTVVVTYLVVAGGGSGGYVNGGSGGGGAGGLLYGTVTLGITSTFPIVVGSGGASVSNGANSSAFGLTAIGGGHGANNQTATGADGGSGGGAPYAGSPGNGTAGQGYRGGYGAQTFSSDPLAQGGAGGGGAGAVGGNGAGNSAGAGGNGLAYSISGTSTYYAGGGGGTVGNGGGGGGGGSGGAGGGGAGGATYVQGTAGTPNTGGGGGAGSSYGGSAAGAGGSGIVIVSYPSSYQRATGGTITTYSSGGVTYYVHTFTASGTFITNQELIMPSTYSPSLKIELIANGEQAGTWGQTTNNNLGTLIEQAITGVGQLSITGDYVLTSYNGLADDARNAVLVFSGTLSAPANVIAPSVQKTYIITNNATANVTIKTSGGNGVVVPPGLNSLIYCDGLNFYTAVNVNNVIGDLTVSGNETIGGSLTMGGNITLANTVTGTSGNLTFTANSSVIDMGNNTGAFIPPTGSTAARPSNLALGMSRWNSTLGWYEIWSGTQWQAITSGASYAINYLIIAGGGGGSGYDYYYKGGGGGAGGYLTGSTSLSSGTTYTITVGAGGAGTSGGAATNGANSSVSGFATAIGGGAGNVGVGSAGGSGGGGGSSSGYVGGAATSGQGNNGGGGSSSSPGADWWSAGGGGGAGAAGANGGFGGQTCGAGGDGLFSTITGTSVARGGGGGGGGPGGSGGVGGGGGSGSAGTSNTGGGGSGGGGNIGGAIWAGAAGGSGVVIISIPTASYTGITTGSPTVTTNGSNTIIQYTSSGTYKA